MIGMLRAERGELVGRAGILQAAPGVEIGQHHDLFGAEDLGRFGHELDPAKGDHFGIGGRRLARQFQRIADEIGQVLDFGLLVIVRQDHGLALLAQAVDLRAQV
jgi:hypothetical protein